MGVSISREGTAEEGWAEVDGDAGEPDHEQAEGDALRTVLEEGESVLGVLVRENGGVVEDRGEEVDGGDGDEEEEGGLHQSALADGLAEEDGPSHREENSGPGAVHDCLVEYQTLAPPSQGPLDQDDEDQDDVGHDPHAAQGGEDDGGDLVVLIKTRNNEKLG